MVVPKQASSSSSSKTAAPAPATNPISLLWQSYGKHTPDRLKFIDCFLVFILLSGVMQFLYLVLVTDFPFNAFLAGYARLLHVQLTSNY